MDLTSFQLSFANDGSFMKQFMEMQQAAGGSKDGRPAEPGSSNEMSSAAERKDEDARKTTPTSRIGGIKIKMKTSLNRGPDLGFARSVATNSRALTNVFDSPDSPEESETSRKRLGNSVWAHEIVWFLVGASCACKSFVPRGTVSSD